MAEATHVEIHTASVAQEIRAPRERVWRYVAEAPKMERWLGDGARVELRIGGRYDFWGPSVYGWREGEGGCHPIMGYDPGERIAFEWDFATRGGVPTRCTRTKGTMPLTAGRSVGTATWFPALPGAG